MKGMPFHLPLHGIFDLDPGRARAFFNNYAMYRDAKRQLTLHEGGELPPSPFGPRAVGYALRTFEGWPATKKRLLEDCGGWFCWVAPDESVKLREVLGEIAEEHPAIHRMFT
jgi:hypothetical protein